MKCVSSRDPEEITTMSQTVLIYLNMNSELFYFTALYSYWMTTSDWFVSIQFFLRNFRTNIWGQVDFTEQTNQGCISQKHRKPVSPIELINLGFRCFWEMQARYSHWSYGLSEAEVGVRFRDDRDHSIFCVRKPPLRILGKLKGFLKRLNLRN